MSGRQATQRATTRHVRVPCCGSRNGPAHGRACWPKRDHQRDPVATAYGTVLATTHWLAMQHEPGQAPMSPETPARDEVSPQDTAFPSRRFLLGSGVAAAPALLAAGGA